MLCYCARHGIFAAHEELRGVMNQSQSRILGLVGVILIAAATYLYWPKDGGFPGGGSSAGGRPPQATSQPATPPGPRGPVVRTVEDPPPAGQPK
jgi:hypothetical protein